MKLKPIILILALILLATAVQGALTDGLVSAWKLDNNLLDERGLNDGTNHSVTFNSSIYADGGYSGVFNGVGAYVDFADNETLKSNSNFTISAWIYADGSPTQRTVYARRVDSNTAMQIYYEGANNLTVYLAGGGSTCTVGTVETVFDSKWNNIIVTYNGTNLSIYRNGSIVSTTTCAAVIDWTGGAGTSTIGRLGSTAAYYWDGEIDEVYFWNRTLSSTEIGQVNGSFYPFLSGATHLYLTAQDSWNGSSISSFSANISWNNGTNGTYSSVGGSIYLENLTTGGTTYNITFWNATDYFDSQNVSVTLVNNTNNSHIGLMHQAEVCFNASEKISNASVIPDNITIESTTQASCFNLSAGTYNVLAQKTGWFNQNQSFTISALQNNTQTVQNMSYANLTIYAIDGTTNTSLSGYNLTIDSLNYTWSGETAGSVTNYSFYLINGTYNVTISMPGYAITEAQANITVNGNTNYTFTLYLANSVSITIRDEITNNPIYDNITIRWSDNTTTWENVTNTSTLFMSNITAGNYTLLFYSSNYSTRSYSITVGPASHQFLTAYMISSTYSTIFTIKDIDTGSILDGVAITMYKLINSTWTTVESKTSDISGKAQFYYDPIANYRFYLSYTGYEDYIFYLNPILFSTYDVYMTRESVLNYSVDFDDISFIYSPTTFTNNVNTSLNFLISSPTGMLTDYAITVTYPGGTDTDSGVNAIGEQLSVDVNVTNATAFDYVVLDFNYTTSLAGTRSYTFNLPINMNITTGTWLTSKDKTYGLGIFERMLIATIIILFVVGIATMVGQALPGVALGLFVYGFLVFIGFVPLWAILPSMLIGVLFLIWKSGGY